MVNGRYDHTEYLGGLESQTDEIGEYKGWNCDIGPDGIAYTYFPTVSGNNDKMTINYLTADELPEES